MTIQQFYRELERLYAGVNWKDKDSVRRYNEAVRELQKMRKEVDEHDA